MKSKMGGCYSGKSEHSPVKFLKREGMSLESSEASREAGKGKQFDEADYISQPSSNPHAAPSAKRNKWYAEHGEGTHFEEDEEYGNEKTGRYHGTDH